MLKVAGQQTAEARADTKGSPPALRRKKTPKITSPRGSSRNCGASSQLFRAQRKNIASQMP
jgi:hypothetical protein